MRSAINMLVAGIALACPQISPAAQSSSLSVSVFFHSDPSTDYWIGDLLRFYDKDQALLARLSAPAVTQSAMYAVRDTVAFDIVDRTRTFQRSDFIPLGRPGKNLAYLTWDGTKLIAQSFETTYCKDSLEASWQSCGKLADRSALYPDHLQQLANQPKRGGQFVQPIFISRNRVLLNDNLKGFSDCEIKDEKALCTKVEKVAQCGYFYSYDLVGNQLSLYCSSGNIYSYNLDERKNQLVVDATGKKISNQIYSTYLLGDSFYLGHYPSGAMMKKTDGSISFTSFPPARNGFSKDRRELQSIGYLGGQLLAGIWPWGEVWASPDAKTFNQSVQLFDENPDDMGHEHPRENELPAPHAYNELGRRITSIVPCWQGVCIATGSKGTRISADTMPTPEYGAVYYLPGPKRSCHVVLSGNQRITLDIGLTGGVLMVDDQAACEFNLDTAVATRLITETATVKVGSTIGKQNGHIGQMLSLSKN